MSEQIIQSVGFLLKLYYYAMFFYILSSWVPALRDSGFGKFLAKLVDPYLNIFRRFIPPLGMIDISAIFAILAYRYLSLYLLEGIYVVLETMGL